MLRILACAFLVSHILAFSNPGVLITIPFPMQPPLLQLSLPIAIDNILISGLQLSKIFARQIEYSWAFSSTRAEVTISLAKVSFDWEYKSDQGIGFFTEQQLRLTFDYQFGKTAQSRLIINIVGSKLHSGKTKVTFGGSVKETVAVEVTNLVLNHASIIFRSIIANKIGEAIQSFSQIIGKDISVFCDKGEGQHNYAGKCVKINTTLVTLPIVYNSTLIIQVNAAPYIEGESSQPLNPPESLQKQNSTKIQIQIHKKLMEVLVEKLVIIKQIDLAIKTNDITSVVSINSMSLASVFPPMRKMRPVRDVVFEVKVSNITVRLGENYFEVGLQATIVTSTQDFKERQRILYMNPAKASCKLHLSPIYGKISSSIRVSDLELYDINFYGGDVSQGLVTPSALTKYIDILMLWAQDAFNLALNRKSMQFSFNQIRAVINGKSLNPNVYCLQATLVQKILI